MVLFMSVTWNTLRDNFLEFKATQIEKADAYRYPINTFIENIATDPVQTTMEIVTKAFRRIKNRYSHNYYAYIYAINKQFLVYGSGEGVLTLPNVERLKTPKQKPTKREFVTRDDLDKMCATLNPWEFWQLRKIVIFRLLFDTGMRVSELKDLNINDLRDGQSNIAEIQTKKSNKQGLVMWSEETDELFKRYLGTRISLSDTQPVFIDRKKHTRLSCRSIQRWVREVCKEAGIKKHITPHSFRHGKAHDVLNKGGNVKEVQAILRHSETNPIASFQYLRLNDSEFMRVAKRFVDRRLNREEA